MKYITAGLHFKERTYNVMHDDDCGMLCVADVDVAVSVFIKGYCVSPCRLWVKFLSLSSWLQSLLSSLVKISA